LVLCTSGRHNHPITSLAPDGLSKSKIGLAGVEPAGRGRSQAHGPARVAVLYQFGSRGFVPEGSESFDLGAHFAGLSVDASMIGVRFNS
jgi:hypothetical protein